jgi:hypothetical protein
MYFKIKFELTRFLKGIYTLEINISNYVLTARTRIYLSYLNAALETLSPQAVLKQKQRYR